MAKMKGASLEQAMPKSENDYQLEDDMRTMHSAAGIASDPSRLKKVHKLAGRKHKALQGMIEPLMKKPKIKSLDDLKARANAPAPSDDDEDMES